MRVLLIDDDALVRQTLADTLVWRDDQSFAPIEVERGKRPSGPGD